MKERDILIWLNNLDGMNNRNIEKLMDYFDDIRDIWGLKNSKINSLQISDRAKKSIVDSRSLEFLDEIKENAKVKNIEIATIKDRNYPQRLKNIPDPPKVLYIKGSLIKKDLNSIAVVGTRKPTPYGIYAVEKLVSELSEYGITIISGMATGIDTYAHLTSLKQDNRTIAVLGTGADTVYPSHNRNLYNKIVKNGAVISEFPLGTKGLPYHFPQRNRIISGLSLGTLVIEAEERSGTLITVTHSLEQGKDVFAVPGCINSSFSRGTNSLIRDGAKLVEKAEDIIEEIIELKDIENNSDNDYYKNQCDKSDLYSGLSDDEKVILKKIKRSPVTIDQLARSKEMNIAKLNGIITVLEMKGKVKRIGGNKLTV